MANRTMEELNMNAYDAYMKEIAQQMRELTQNGFTV